MEESSEKPNSAPDGPKGEAETGEAPDWTRHLESLRSSGKGDGRPGSNGGTSDSGAAERRLTADAPPAPEDAPGVPVERLLEQAREAAAADAEEGRPGVEETTPTRRESALREKVRAAFDRWQLAERDRLRERLTECEEKASNILGRASLLLDRFQRLTNELIRLEAERRTRKQEVEEKLETREKSDRALPTSIYLPAVAFMGLVEFFANAPVFSTLLPRDPLTEQQIRVITETSTGWLAGIERVLAQLVLRPDAALLAAGVVTFLFVLAHFFGHSLRDLVMHWDGRSRRDAVQTRSPAENAVPLLLAGLGLVLVLGVLFEARVIMGDVGQERYEEDMAAVEELRREAGWLRSDGELLEANEMTDRAEDMEAAAERLRNYATSMSRMSFPILLLNVTLVLAAITAAYFHRRTGTGEGFNESPFEADRERLIERAEETASELSELLSRAIRPVRRMSTLVENGASRNPTDVARRLESVVEAYRRETARRRGLEPDDLAAFREPPELGLSADGGGPGVESFRRSAEGAEEELNDLTRRFREAREKFNAQLSGWDPQSERG